MRKNRLLTVLSLFLLVSASITRAQTVSSQKGLTTAVFTLSQGKISVFLPDDIRPGENFSGTILMEPVGRNAKQIESNRKALMAQSISFNGNKINVDKATQQFQIGIPAGQAGDNKLHVSSANGKNPLSATIPSKPAGQQVPVSSNCVLPSHALAGSPNSIKGSFDGNLQNTSCKLDGAPIIILAESFSQSIVYYPQSAASIQKMTMQESGKQECSGNVSGVTLSARTGKKTLVTGEQTYLEIAITGLANLPGLATLQIDNLSTNTVSLLPTNNIIIPLLPDSVSTGTFNRSFIVQSIRSGDFTMSVNLNLPDQDHPPTQPQPNPTDTTVAQCPKCHCECKISLTNEGTIGDETIFMITVTASCSGQWGTPPCENCSLKKYKYDWTISFSADKPMDWLDNEGEIVKVKNPHKGDFSIWVVVEITCSDGSTCSATASETVHPPTEPIKEVKCLGCLCECSTIIQAVDTEGDEWEYVAIVTAVCFRNFGVPPCDLCKTKEIKYLWSMPKEDVAKIVGSKTGSSVKLRTIKPGKFVLNVDVTVVCSDGHQCTCPSSITGEVPDKGCILSWKEINTPLMTGGLDPTSLLTNKEIKRDEFIMLKAWGSDMDKIKFICTPLADCPDRPTVRIKSLTGMVKFSWKIKSGKGSFVKLGCFGGEQETDGDHVIFQPPYVPLPITSADSTFETVIELTVLDDNPYQAQDPSLTRTITIITKRIKASPEIYKVTVSEKKGEDAKSGDEDKPNEGDCTPESLPWLDATPIKKPVINLPQTNDNDKLLPGEWIRLEAYPQVDLDGLITFCESRVNKCDPFRVFANLFADSLKWEWTATAGKFVGYKELKAFGRAVIFEAPSDITKLTVITITLKVDDMGSKFNDDPQSATVTLKIYPAGVKMDYPPENWLPDTAKLATMKSYLVYKDGDTWKPGFEHSCRIHFFELMDVSNEPGICLNAPALVDAKKCRDLKIKTEEGQESYNDKPLKECESKEYFVQARTEVPASSYELKIKVEDYGARGFIRSFINYGLNEKAEAIFGIKPGHYQSIPVKKTDVKHPLENPAKKELRPKKTEYPDNRVNMPKDIDENNIPDDGWGIALTIDDKGKLTKMMTFPDYKVNNDLDTDQEPVGDGYPGDGLSLYEEYRGFMVKEEHRRTDPSRKDLFVNNDAPLPVDSFVSAAHIPVHEIKSTQYGPLEQNYFDKHLKKTKHNIRFVNFNFSIGHTTNQKGLFLTNVAIVNKAGANILGETPSETDEGGDNITPAPPNWNLSVKVDKAKIIAECNKDPKDALVEETKLQQVVAHELCHALNVYHHGEVTDGGLTSGDLKCIMRYDNMTVRNETPGTILCTEVKTANKTKDRGKCAFQLRVSGKFEPNETKGYRVKKL